MPPDLQAALADSARGDEAALTVVYRELNPRLSESRGAESLIGSRGSESLTISTTVTLETLEAAERRNADL